MAAFTGAGIGVDVRASVSNRTPMVMAVVQQTPATQMLW
jgi:hypothetical protein